MVNACFFSNSQKTNISIFYFLMLGYTVLSCTFSQKENIFVAASLVEIMQIIANDFLAQTVSEVALKKIKQSLCFLNQPSYNLKISNYRLSNFIKRLRVLERFFLLLSLNSPINA